MRTQVNRISRKEGVRLMKRGYPKGLYWYKDTDRIVAIDNSSGEVWTRGFISLNEAISWLLMLR